MANKPIATVNVSLQTSTVAQKGFGTPIFISTHNAFPERVRTYGSLPSVGDDFDSTDAAYIAAQGVFSNTPSVAEFKVGRRLADAIVTPLEVSNGSIHKFTLTVDGGDTFEVEITAGESDDAADVAAAMKAAIDVSPITAKVVTAVVGATTAGTLTIAPATATDSFGVSEKASVALTAETSTESAGDVLDAIFEQDDTFYFVTAEDHTEAFVTAMAATVEARTMLYFVSTQEAQSITTAYSVASTDLLAKLAQSGYERTALFWNQVADTTFPECQYVGINAPWSPDQRAVGWSGVEASGMALSKNAQGNTLTGTQEKNLFDRNVSYNTVTAAGNRILGGKVASGKWLDEIRIRDTIIARVMEGQQTLLLNQAGGKVTGNAEGIAMCEAQMQANLNPFVASKALDSYTTSSANATIDYNTRTLNNLEFTGVLAGAIFRVVINGTLTNK